MLVSASRVNDLGYTGYMRSSRRLRAGGKQVMKWRAKKISVLQKNNMAWREKGQSVRNSNRLRGRDAKTLLNQITAQLPAMKDSYSLPNGGVSKGRAYPSNHTVYSDAQDSCPVWWSSDSYQYPDLLFPSLAECWRSPFQLIPCVDMPGPAVDKFILGNRAETVFWPGVVLPPPSTSIGEGQSPSENVETALERLASRESPGGWEKGSVWGLRRLGEYGPVALGVMVESYETVASQPSVQSGGSSFRNQGSVLKGPCLDLLHVWRDGLWELSSPAIVDQRPPVLPPRPEGVDRTQAASTDSSLVVVMMPEGPINVNSQGLPPPPNTHDEEEEWELIESGGPVIESPPLPLTQEDRMVRACLWALKSESHAALGPKTPFPILSSTLGAVMKTHDPAIQVKKSPWKKMSTFFKAQPQ